MIVVVLILGCVATVLCGPLIIRATERIADRVRGRQIARDVTAHRAAEALHRAATR